MLLFWEEVAQVLDLKISFSTEYHLTQITKSILYDIKNANVNYIPQLKKLLMETLSLRWGNL